MSVRSQIPPSALSAVLPLLASLAAVGMLLPLAGCSRDSDPATPAKPTVAGAPTFLVGGDERDPAWQAITSAAKQAADRNANLKLSILSRPHGEPRTPADLVQQAVAAGAKIVGLWVTEPKLHVDAERLAEQGIQLITLNAPVDNWNGPQLIVDYTDAVDTLAEDLPNLAPETTSYVLIHQAAANARSAQLLKRFRQAAPQQVVSGQNPRFVRLADYDRSEWPGPVQELLASILDEYPHVSLIITLDPELWLADLPPVQLPPGKRFITLGSAMPLWERLRQGEALALCGPIHGEIGRVFVAMASDAAAPRESPPRRRFVDCETITAANLDAFTARYVEAAGLRGHDLDSWRYGGE
jgi:hypothetical protein